MSATLYALALSPPSLAARCMLEHKRIDHRVVDIVPGMQPVVLRALRFPRHTVPALVVDGRRIQGSREIARALEQLRGDPPLFPSDAAARRRVEEAERWGEQVLQPMPRRIFRWMAAREYVVRRWLAVEAAGVPLGAVFARPSLQARLFARASKPRCAASPDSATWRRTSSTIPRSAGPRPRCRRCPAPSRRRCRTTGCGRWSGCSDYSPRCALEAGFVTATENFDGCSRTAGLSISEMRSISLIH